MSFLPTQQSIDILICEDNLGDVYIINNVLKNSTASYDLHHVNNGEAAMNYLQKRLSCPYGDKQNLFK